MENKKTRRPSITQKIFEQCVSEMLADDITPTVTEIVQNIGGSYTTVSRMLDEWKQTQKKAIKSPLAIPGFVREAAESMSQQWWNTVQSDVVEKIERANHEADARIEEVKKERDEFLVSTSGFEQQLEDEKEVHKKELDAVKDSYEKSLVEKQDELIEKISNFAVDAEKIKNKDKMISGLEGENKRFQKESDDHKQVMIKQVELLERSLKNSQNELINVKAFNSKALQEAKADVAAEKVKSSTTKKEVLATSKKVEEVLNQLLSQKNKLMDEKNKEIANLSGKLDAQGIIVIGLESQLTEALKKKRA